MLGVSTSMEWILGYKLHLACGVKVSCLEEHKAAVTQLLGVTTEKSTPVIIYAQT